MCIIAMIPQGETIDNETIETMGKNNNHGFGVAYIDKNKDKIVTFKTLNIDEYINNAIRIVKTKSESSPILIHCRIKTSGKQNKDNCHPFKVNKKTIFAHNGALSFVDDTQPNISDTRMFNKTYLKYMGDKWLDDKNMVSHIEQLMGSFNKLTFLTTNTKLKKPFYILNEKQGEWNNKVWYSNTSYKDVSIYKYVYDTGYDYEINSFSNYEIKRKVSDDIENSELSLILGEYEQNEIKNGFEKIEEIELSNNDKVYFVHRKDGIIDEYDNDGQYVDSIEPVCEITRDNIPAWNPHQLTNDELFYDEELTDDEKNSKIFKIHRDAEIIKILKEVSEYSDSDLWTMKDDKFKEVFIEHFDTDYLMYKRNTHK